MTTARHHLTPARRWVAVLAGTLALVAAACGSSDSDESTAAVDTTDDVSTPTTGDIAAPTTGDVAAPTTAELSDSEVTEADQRILAQPSLFEADPEGWASTQEAAADEGTVVVHGPNIPGLAESLSAAFAEAHGLTLEWISLPPGQLVPRLQQELAAGGATVDLVMGGSCFVNNEAGVLQDVRDDVIDPALFEAGTWQGDQIRPLFGEPGTPEDYYCGVQAGLYVMPDLFVNPNSIDPAAITSWQDLLKPEYAGKIATFDPAIGGPAGTTVGYLARVFGDDFVKDLFINQDVTYSTDLRQQAEWLVRGTYPIVLGLPHIFVEQFVAEGLKAERVIPPDGPGSLTGGYNTLTMVDKPPHPAAATVFLNWFLTQEAQQIVVDAALEPSLRTDVDLAAVPDYVLPLDEYEYPVDDYSPTHFFTYRAPAQAMLKEELGG